MTDTIMCQKIYGQRERGGEKEWKAHFLSSPPPLKIIVFSGVSLV